MSEQRTLIDQITPMPDGVVLVRFQKQTIERGLLTFEYHRTSVPPGTDPAAQIAAVNAHLEAMGKARVGDYRALADKCAEVHTPQVIAAYKKKLEEKKE